MTNHSTDLRDKFLALIERMEKAEDENARLRAELGALKAELEAAKQTRLPDNARYAVDPIYDNGEYYITGADINEILQG